MSDYIQYNACDLDRLIESTYGKKFEVPYFMQDQKLYKVFGVCCVIDGFRDWVDDQIVQLENSEKRNLEMLEAIMSDLCTKGLLEAGDYLLEFDD